MSLEIWKDIPEFDGRYQVSTWGRVRSARGIMAPYENEKGYLKVALLKNGKQYKRRIHRLVAEAFIPNPGKREQVNHIDGNPKNNSVTNLEWVTNDENCLQARVLRLIRDTGVPESITWQNVAGMRMILFNQTEDEDEEDT